MKDFLFKILFIFSIVFLSVTSIELAINSKLSHFQFLQKDNNVYFNPKYFSSIIDYKLSQKTHHQVSIIGTSRTAGFEKKMFNNKNVYNYSLLINSVQDIFNLVKDLKLRQGDTLLLGLDQSNFNKNYGTRLNNTYEKNFLKFPYLLFEKSKRYKNNYLIGYKSINNFSGFRNDGSYYYGKRYITPPEELEDYNFRNTTNKIKKGILRFQYGNETDINQIKLIEQMLMFLKQKGVVVYGFFPPFAPSISKIMMSSKYDYSYIDKSSKALENVFNNSDFYFKDFSYSNNFYDINFLDGVHFDENINYEILKALKIPVNKQYKKQYNNEELQTLKSYFNTVLTD